MDAATCQKAGFIRVVHSGYLDAAGEGHAPSHQVVRGVVDVAGVAMIRECGIGCRPCSFKRCGQRLHLRQSSRPYPSRHPGRSAIGGLLCLAIMDSRGRSRGVHGLFLRRGLLPVTARLSGRGEVKPQRVAMFMLFHPRRCLRR